MNNNALETLAAALGYTKEEVAEMAANGELYLEIKNYYNDKPDFDNYVSDELAELKREQREFGRSRLAQFGKTFPNRKRRVKPRPYWFRTRSFCVRSPYG